MHRASVEPFIQFDPAAVHDGPHCAEWKNATSMVSDNYLFACNRITPLLMASGNADQLKPILSQDFYNLV
jgi:hypothetical protein